MSTFVYCAAALFYINTWFIKAIKATYLNIATIVLNCLFLCVLVGIR